MLHVSITDRATPAIERMDKQALVRLRDGNRARAERYQIGLRDATPRGKGERPGRLKAAWRVDDQGDAQRLHNDTPYLRYVIQGRGPVVASPGKMLRFVISGRVFFRKRVGPAAANDFISRTLPGLEARDKQDAEKVAQAIAAEMR